MPDATAWPRPDLVAERAAATPDRTAVVDTSGLDRVVDGRPLSDAALDGDEPVEAAATPTAGDADDVTTVTYRALDAAVEARASALAALVDSGEEAPTVAVAMNTRLAFVELLFATMRLGGRFVPVDTGAPATALAERLDRAEADCLVCDLGTETVAMDVADAASDVDRPVATVDQFTRADVPSLASVAQAGDACASSGTATLAGDDTALVVFTSGTTGEAKGVRLTTRNLVASASASAFRLGVEPSDRWLACLPPYHVGGLAPMVRSVLYGTTVVLQPEFGVDETPAVIDRQDVTGVSLVPTMLRRLLDAGWRAPEHLRFALLGGGAASTGLLDEATSVGVPVCPTYGSSETASQVATARTEDVLAHEGTVGQPLVTSRVTIVDGDGQPCDPGERGEIVVDGPTVMAGYLDPDRTDEAFGEFGYQTGDCGYRDDDGRLWVLGRLDAQIVTGGENVAPSHVADVIREHPDVRDVAVVGVDDPEWGERVAAMVEPREAASLSAYDVRGYCRTRLADYEVPKTVGFAASIPRTASGTVDRDAVRDRLRDGPIA
jgi:O-succinylbenzoic acid--CoA ligase